MIFVFEKENNIVIYFIGMMGVIVEIIYIKRYLVYCLYLVNVSGFKFFFLSVDFSSMEVVGMERRGCREEKRRR